MTAELMNIQKLSVQKIIYKEDTTLMIFVIKLLNILLNVIHVDAIRIKEMNIIMK